MNRFEILLLVVFCCSPLLNYGQHDSLTLKKMETVIKQQDSLLTNLTETVANLNNNILTHDGNVLTNGGNILTYAGFILALVSVIVGLGGFIVIRDSYKKLREAEKDIKKATSNALEAEEKFKQRATEIDNTHKEVLLKEVRISLLEGKLQNNVNDIEAKNAKISEEISAMRNEFSKKSDIVLQTTLLYSDGIKKLNEGKIDRSITLLNRVINIDAENINAKGGLAMCHSGKGDNVRAVTDILPLVNLPDASEEIFIFCGIIYGRAGIYDLSLSYFEKAIKSDKNRSDKTEFSTYNHLGYTCLSQKDFKKSEDYFNKSLGQKPNNAAATYGLLKIFILNNGNDPDKKTELINNACETALKDIYNDPETPQYRFGYAFALMCKNEDNTDCINELNKALEKCKNVGILEAMLREYKMFESTGIELKNLQSCINKISSSISNLRAFYKTA